MTMLYYSRAADLLTYILGDDGYILSEHNYIYNIIRYGYHVLITAIVHIKILRLLLR